MYYSRHRFTTIDELKENVRSNHQTQKLGYIFDIQFGSNLSNIETGETRMYYPSSNTSFYEEGDQPVINNSITELLDSLQLNSIIDGIRRENSKWTVRNLYEYVILTTPLEGIPIGSNIKLPKFIINSNSINGFGDVDNNMCFWFCLASFKSPATRLDRLTRKATQLYKEYYKNRPGNNYKGVNILELDDIETYFKLCINVYRLQEIKGIMENHSSNNFKDVMNLNIYTDKKRNNFSLITKINNYTKVFQCVKCDTFLSSYKKLKPHSLICNEGKPKIIFEEGSYQPKKTIFEQLDMVGIHVPKELRMYPFFIFLKLT